MSKPAIALGIGLGAALLVVSYAETASACGSAKQQMATLRSLTVDQLATVLQNHPNVTVLDVNGTDTRTRYGVIPGAKLLSHFAEYDVGKELPADKNAILVFYCAATQCTSAGTAAQRALAAGYVNVFVLDAGIKGWTEAGHATRKVAVTTAST